MITFNFLLLILTLGVLIHSVENKYPKFLIFLEILLITFCAAAIIYYYASDDGKKIAEPVGKSYYTILLDSAYTRGYRDGRLDCNSAKFK